MGFCAFLSPSPSIKRCIATLSRPFKAKNSQMQKWLIKYRPFEITNLHQRFKNTANYWVIPQNSWLKDANQKKLEWSINTLKIKISGNSFQAFCSNRMTLKLSLNICFALGTVKQKSLIKFLFHKGLFEIMHFYNMPVCPPQTTPSV